MRHCQDQAAACLGADAQPRRQFLGRAAVRVFDGARAGRADHGEADEVGGRGDGSGGGVGQQLGPFRDEKTA